MDEPSRGIDVGAKYEVYNIMNRLAAEGSGILFISSEVEELIGVADRIVVMSRGEVMKIFDKKDFDVTALMAAAFREDVA
jgi:ABC-type sugar transport system ATPase subunit